MAAFQVYCDESGEFKDKKCVSFAAVIFPSDDIATYVQKWKGMLADAGIKYLTMKEAMNFTGEFEDWRDRIADRDDLLESLGSFVQAQSIFHTNSTVDSESFRAFPDPLRRKLRSITYAAFETLIKGIAEFSKTVSESRFHLIYDMSEGYSAECLKLFIRLRMMQSAYKQFFTALSFADDCDYPPLQGADMLAYCFRQKRLRTDKGITKKTAGDFS